MDAAFITKILSIILLDIVLSGDNAVVIALACRNLPKRQRKKPYSSVLQEPLFYACYLHSLQSGYYKFH